MDQKNNFLEKILTERKRQDEKQKEFESPIRNAYEYLSILMEEVGEVAEAMNKNRPFLEIEKELVQVAAVSMAFAENAEERNYFFEDGNPEEHGK